MTERTHKYSDRLRVEPYWYLIALFLLGAIVLFAYHQISGRTPSRVALHIGIFDFDIFWYGVFIVAGIALGAYVTARLALERGQRLFAAEVPARLRRSPVSRLKLPAEIQKVLSKNKIETMGDLLLQWGFNPERTGLNQAGREEVRKLLGQAQTIKETWLDDAPWRQWNPDFVWGGIGWILVLSVVGARLYHVLTPSPSMAALGISSAADYFRNPYQLINLRNGGLGIYGGIIGGAIGLFLYARRHHISAIAWTDLGAIGLSLGQSIGRWGNFFNQELYGKPSDLPWAITIDPIHRLPEYADFSRFHPAFLYESLWSLMTFFILLYLARRQTDRLLTGDLTALYLILYATGRILLEFVRLDSRTLSIGGMDLGLPIATVVSFVIAISMAAFLAWRHLIARNAG